MAKKTKRQIIAWDSSQRQSYKRGNLSASQIKQIESLPGWYWALDNEAHSNRKTHEVCDFIDQHNRIPLQKVKNKKEQTLANFITMKRQAKKGSKSWVFYASDQKILEERGYPDLFQSISKESISNVKTHKVCDFIDKHNRMPANGSKHIVEFQLARFIQNRRLAKSTIGRFVFYPSDQKIAEERGCPDLFNFVDREYNSNLNVHRVCDFIDKFNRMPSVDAKNTFEKKLAGFVSKKRKATNNRPSAFFISDKKIAEQRGYPDLLEMVDLEAQSNKKVHEVCDFIDKHGKTPKADAKDKEEERKLGRFIQTKRKTKRNKGIGIFYVSDQKILEERGYSHLFEIVDLELESNRKTHEVCDFIDKYGRIPRADIKDKEEQKLGRFVSTKRKVKQNKGRKKGIGIFYVSDQQILEERGYSDLLEMVDLEAQSNKKVHEVCDFIDKHGRKPSHHAKDKKERALGYFVSDKRKAKQNKGREKGIGIFYISDQQILEERGYSHLFEQGWNLSPMVLSNG